MKILNDFISSVKETYEREGLFAAILWGLVLPIYMMAAVVTNFIYDF